MDQLQVLENQVRIRLSAFVNKCGIVPTDIFLGHDERTLLHGAPIGAWAVTADGTVAYRGVTVHEVDRKTFIGVGLSA